jgi:hypothetical protein
VVRPPGAATGLLLASACGGGVLLVKRLRLPRAPGEPRAWSLVPLIVILSATVPMTVAGISVLARAGGGLYWLVPELLLAVAGWILNAWILLIEIQR